MNELIISQELLLYAEMNCLCDEHLQGVSMTDTNTINHDTSLLGLK